MKKLVWPLLSLLALVVIFFALVHSDAYYFADVDGLEIGLYILIFLNVLPDNFSHRGNLKLMGYVLE